MAQTQCWTIIVLGPITALTYVCPDKRPGRLGLTDQNIKANTHRLADVVVVVDVGIAQCVLNSLQFTTTVDGFSRKKLKTELVQSCRVVSGGM